MRYRPTKTLAALAVAALLLTGEASAADAAPRLQTQTFQAQGSAPLLTSANSFVIAETDLVGSSAIGHDVLDCALNASGSACDVAFAQTGGIIYAHLDLHDGSTTFVGIVDGGTGLYRHARGILTGLTLSPGAEQITLRYIA